LQKLLTHVAALTYKGPLSVIVIENDAELRPAPPRSSGWHRTSGSRWRVSWSPAAGRPMRTTADFFAGAHALPPPDYIAILDDDEYPTRHG